MTETLTGRQVLALLAQDEVPEIECYYQGKWVDVNLTQWTLHVIRNGTHQFRIKPKPARRLSVTLASGEVVAWPEPVREALKDGQVYYALTGNGEVVSDEWIGEDLDKNCIKAGNVHLTREAAQEHADALRKINTQGVV